MAVKIENGKELWLSKGAKLIGEGLESPLILGEDILFMNSAASEPTFASCLIEGATNGGYVTSPASELNQNSEYIAIVVAAPGSSFSQSYDWVVSGEAADQNVEQYRALAEQSGMDYFLFTMDADKNFTITEDHTSGSFAPVEKTISTKQVNTGGIWVKAEDELGITLEDDKIYTIQVIGVAKLSYSATVPVSDCFTISFPQPFTYEKKSGEDLYILTTDNLGAVITIAG